jgi:hypothetical protein
MENLLLYELGELHEYVRHQLHIYVTWFSFFLTLLLGAMSWTLRASVGQNGRINSAVAFYAMYVLFAVQLAFSLVGTNAVQLDLQTAIGRAQTLVSTLNLSSPAIPILSPIPQGYVACLDLMFWTLASNLVFWTVIAILVAVAWKRGTKVGNASN